MATRYSEGLFLVVPVGRQSAGRAAYRQLEAADPVPGNQTPEDARLFSRGLSADGLAPATHFGIGPKITSAMRNRLAEQVEPIPGAFWARVANPGTTLIETNAPSAPAAGSRFGWEEFLALVGLKLFED